MASEYLKWKYRDVKPDEPVQLTPAQKRANWWYYHKWYVAAGAALLIFLGSWAWRALGFGTVKPDYQAAYVGGSTLPDDTARAIEAALAALGEDLNGDGRVVVRLNQYASSDGADAGAETSAEVLLMSDILDCESYFFLLEDPEAFQLGYHSLCRLDGSLPEKTDVSADQVCLLWSQCPALAGQTLGEYSDQLLGQTVTGSSDELVSGLYLARRGFWTDQTTAYPEGCAALWARLTEGAIS